MILDFTDGLQDKPDDYTKTKVNGVDVAKILFVVGDKDNSRMLRTCSLHRELVMHLNDSILV